jgi:hypothetical protein
MGYATFLAWFSLNGYLNFSQKYANVIKTLMYSAKSVANGLVGIAPVAVGMAMFSTTILFYQFRFKDFPNALMTMFYIMNGDTMFDTITGINQVSFLYTLVFTYFWIWFGNNVVMNITLAMVEDGYVD